MSDYDEFIDEEELPLIVCVEDENSMHDCTNIISILRKAGLRNTDEVFIAPTDWLVNKEFKHDEMVEHRLKEQKSLGMNRNLIAYEMDDRIPRQAIAVTDHEKYDDMIDFQIEREILRTIYHEDAHLAGITDEQEAERYAQDKYLEVDY